MKYEFYDRDGNLLGERENPQGTANLKGEVLALRFEGLTATHWRVIDATDPVDGVQKVTVRPILQPISQ